MAYVNMKIVMGTREKLIRNPEYSKPDNVKKLLVLAEILVSYKNRYIVHIQNF